MEKLKVLQIIPNFDVGGAEKVVLDYLLNQDKGNIEMKAISLYKYKDTIYTRIAQTKNIDIVYLNKKPGIDFNIISQINKIIKEYKPDVIHTHLYSLKYVILPTLINKIKKRFHTIHSKPEKDSKGINKFINKIGFKCANFIPITLHNNMKELTNEYYDIKSSVVLENGIDFSGYNQILESKEEIKKTLDIPYNSFVIGHVGSFKEVKNHDFIVKLFNNVIKEKSNAYLVFVGDGPLKNIIEDKVAKLGLNNKVKFLGIRSDIPRILKSFDAFVFPSLYEGFPVALIEAQISGIKSVVSSNIDKSVIINSNVIQIGLDEDIKKWTTEILNTTNDEVKLQHLKKYSIEQIIKKLEFIYRG